MSALDALLASVEGLMAEQAATSSQARPQVADDGWRPTPPGSDPSQGPSAPSTQPARHPAVLSALTGRQRGDSRSERLETSTGEQAHELSVLMSDDGVAPRRLGGPPTHTNATPTAAPAPNSLSAPNAAARRSPSPTPVSAPSASASDPPLPSPPTRATPGRLLANATLANAALVASGAAAAPSSSGSASSASSSAKPRMSVRYTQSVSMETEVIAQLNVARTTPKLCAELLRQQRRPQFVERNLLYLDPTVPSAPTHLQTAEGPAAVDDAVSFLSEQPALASFRVSLVLSSLAKSALRECSSAGDPAACSALDLGLGQCCLGGLVAELISTGEGNARELVQRLLVCDADPTRTHRAALYNERLKYLGVAYGDISTPQRKILIILLAEEVI